MDAIFEGLGIPFRMSQSEIDHLEAMSASAKKIARLGALFDFLERLAQMTDDQVAVAAGETGVEQAILKRLSVFARDIDSLHAALDRSAGGEGRPQGAQHVIASEGPRGLGGIDVISHGGDHLASPDDAQ